MSVICWSHRASSGGPSVGFRPRPPALPSQRLAALSVLAAAPRDLDAGTLKMCAGFTSLSYLVILLCRLVLELNWFWF